MEEMYLDGRALLRLGTASPEVLLLQCVDEADESGLGEEFSLLEASGLRFSLLALRIADWNGELSPWRAPPVFGKIPFAGKAPKTLAFIEDRVLPFAFETLGKPLPVILGGYSLAGLFALWASTGTDAFSGAAAASPSVWFPGFREYIAAHPPKAKRVYLSLGDKEERAKNKVMATVGENIRAIASALPGEIASTLEMNPGNHFVDAPLRTAKAFLWASAPCEQTKREAAPGSF